jgi:hypothetical protein
MVKERLKHISKRSIVAYFIILLFSSATNSAFAGRCTGSSYCTACTTCSSCKYCNSGGGSCGVCGGGSGSYGVSGSSGSSGVRGSSGVSGSSNWLLWTGRIVAGGFVLILGGSFLSQYIKNRNNKNK